MKSKVAKIFGWVAAGALSLSQLGFHIGHIGNSDVLGLIGAIAGAVGIHNASNTDGKH